MTYIEDGYREFKVRNANKTLRDTKYIKFYGKYKWQQHRTNIEDGYRAPSIEVVDCY